MNHALPHPASPATPLPLARTVPLTAGWRDRARRLLTIDFEELRALDLGPPEDLDAHVCEQFERRPCPGE